MTEQNMTAKTTVDKADQAVQLRATITTIQILEAMLAEALKDGQVGITRLTAFASDYLAKIQTQLLCATNLIAQARMTLPAIGEIERRIAALNAPVPPENITNDFGDKVRTTEHGENLRQSDHDHIEKESAA